MISFLIIFMVSGTTGVIAINLKRQFIEVKVDADRFAVARHRIARVEPQLLQQQRGGR
jgi:DNA modification methylase